MVIRMDKLDDHSRTLLVGVVFCAIIGLIVLAGFLN